MEIRQRRSLRTTISGKRSICSTHPALRLCAANCKRSTVSLARTYPTRNSRMGAMHQLPVVPICRMGSRLRRRANQKHLLAYPVSMKRYVRAVVTTREAGMRWTRMARQTNVANADGEVVWSWPPDAEAKFAG